MVENTELERPNCGGYQILKTLGAGGNAVVKLVVGNGNKRAMKIFQWPTEQKERMLQATRAEYQVVSALDVDDVARYYEFQENAVWQKKNG